MPLDGDSFDPSRRAYVRLLVTRLSTGDAQLPLGITIDLPDWAPAEAAQVLRLSRYDSAIRGHLVYPPAFDVLEH